MTPRQVQTLAFAKINLDLLILGRRPDGYHELRTTFQSIELHDVLTVRPRPGAFVITATDPEVPCGPDNLVWRAAQGIWNEVGRSGEPRDVVVHLEKQIPLQAGLGGGSADAAAALFGLPEAWGLDLPMAKLDTLARGLGADVPFFLRGGVALGTGRGDAIELLGDRAARWIVLVLPAFGVSTVEAYGWFDEGPQEPLTTGSARDTGANDLEAVVARHHPEIASIRSLLEDSGAQAAAMSGSGSAVYGEFGAEDAARAAAARVRDAGWRSLLTRTLTREEWQRRSRPTGLPTKASENARPWS